jgi:hypothetical protein
MKKREDAAPAAAANRPAGKSRETAFSGQQRSGTDAKKALDRGKSSTKREVASRDARPGNDAARVKRDGAERPDLSRSRASSGDRERGRAAAQRGGERERRR